MSYISQYCQDEKCHCGKSAVKKIQEVIYTAAEVHELRNQSFRMGLSLGRTSDPD